MLRTITEVHGQKPVFFGIDSAAPVFASTSKTEDSREHFARFSFRPAKASRKSRFRPTFRSRKTYGIQRPGGLLYRTPFRAFKGRNRSRNPRTSAGSRRNHLIETPALTILDDCYNANPASMKASLDVLSLACGHRTAVLGDMKELGENEDRLHFETGEYAARKGIDQIICIGPLAENMYQGAKILPPAIRYSTIRTKNSF